MAIAALVLWVLTAAAARGPADRRERGPAGRRPGPGRRPVQPPARPPFRRPCGPRARPGPGHSGRFPGSPCMRRRASTRCWSSATRHWACSGWAAGPSTSAPAHAALAWVAFGILVVTILAGLGWAGTLRAGPGARHRGRHPVPLPVPAGPAARRRRGGHGDTGRPHRPVRHPLTRPGRLLASSCAACDPVGGRELRHGCGVDYVGS